MSEETKNTESQIETPEVKEVATETPVATQSPESIFQTLTVLSMEEVITVFQFPIVRGWISIIRAKCASNSLTRVPLDTSQI